MSEEFSVLRRDAINFSLLIIIRYLNAQQVELVATYTRNLGDTQRRLRQLNHDLRLAQELQNELLSLQQTFNDISDAQGGLQDLPWQNESILLMDQLIQLQQNFEQLNTVVNEIMAATDNQEIANQNAENIQTLHNRLIEISGNTEPITTLVRRTISYLMASRKENKEDRTDKRDKRDKRSRKRDRDDQASTPSENTTPVTSERTTPEPEVKKRKVIEESDKRSENGDIPDHLLLSNFRISQSTIDNLEKKGIKSLFDIQAATFDTIFDGKDVLARARTGTGKTLAFAIPVVERLALDKDYKERRGRAPRVLVLCPTRDLAKQVCGDFEQVSGNRLKTLPVYGVNVYGRSGLTVIFCATKADANELGAHDKIKQDAAVLHGDIAQASREATMKAFREGKYKCIVCTDVLARGLDIPQVDLVINCQPPKDPETYVHRSGRTGRAGRSGVCVTFYKPAEEGLLSYISKRTGVQFEQLSAPRPEDIIEATTEDAFKSIDLVKPDVLPYFEEPAKQLIEKHGAVNAVAAALAFMTGYHQGVPSRSLLTSQEGQTTLLAQISYAIQHPGYIRNIITREYPELGYDDVKGWRMTQDSMGVVFDIKSSRCEVTEDGEVLLVGRRWTARNITLSAPKSLPPLQDREVRGGGGGGYNRGNSYGRGNSYNNNNRSNNSYGNNNYNNNNRGNYGRRNNNSNYGGRR
ncbi:hypothetical protein RMCBS344292_08852 [Rhizopus microsporus]|nr:hypothetical protein RMCBS344292_08852 [Rhizopus microsporus]